MTAKKSIQVVQLQANARLSGQNKILRTNSKVNQTPQMVSTPVNQLRHLLLVASSGTVLRQNIATETRINRTDVNEKIWNENVHMD